MLICGVISIIVNSFSIWFISSRLFINSSFVTCTVCVPSSSPVEFTRLTVSMSGVDILLLVLSVSYSALFSFPMKSSKLTFLLGFVDFGFVSLLYDTDRWNLFRDFSRGLLVCFCFTVDSRSWYSLG